MKIKILCTLGPASLRGDVIRALEERGVDLFRINLSHTPPEAVEPDHRADPPVLQHPDLPRHPGGPGPLREDGRGRDPRAAGRSRLAADVVGTEERMILWPASVFESMRPGDLVTSTSTGRSSR